MAKTRSRKSQETCAPSTSPNAYESLRLARIAENQARMAALGVQKCAGDLKSFFSVTKSPRRENSSAKKAVNVTPLRRSERLKDKPLPISNTTPPRRSNRVYSSFTPDLEKKDFFELADDFISTKGRRHYARNKLEENGEVRPANAPIPMCSPAQLQVSPELLAHRCDSKSRGSIYDPILGLCCHFCRQKKLCGEEGCERCGNRDGTQACLGKTDCSVCHSSTGVFCRACLKIRYGEDIEEVRKNKKWMCPHCSEEKGTNPYWICNSSFCLKKRNIPPTGIAIFTAREMGYESVAHYLVDVLKKRGFSG
ncbi:hypothetical protein SUGI_0180980 [Cryptomeria japonica]|uniref:uncharacterized protein LOC131038086 isoform X2 n=1 Tax=Cryptomeria japonica TaxID=3369 RepID=UPI002408CA5D|nr:uncharacterized protein LOC131038086 isoform X2 [Cryptomeria japonica]GLJ11958.1 hypothetical protein SUGI_0180980 [Cryptomeria japonica]